jgi:DUF971 family protein
MDETIVQPISIKKSTPDTLNILWDDDHQTTFSLEQLRRMCPCATCSGENLLLHHFPAQPAPITAESIKLEALQPVGSYAIQAVWGDGHNAGIYTWEYLREHCLCPQCTRHNPNPGH